MIATEMPKPSDLPPRRSVEAMCRRRWLRDPDLTQYRDELRDGRVFAGWQVWIRGQPIAAIFYNGREARPVWQGSDIQYTRVRWGVHP
jgi:hypothetical protein